MAVEINSVKVHSLADKRKIVSGDVLLKINSHKIEDFLDYNFYLSETKLRLEIKSKSGKIRILTLRKDEYEDIGLVFDDYLMDKQRSCRNKCVFCFIDQMPPGMRETLYFKDDDSRLSFLFGNYITLTNLNQHDIDRILEMHISPINISVHTTDPELRCKMMNNKNAGDSLKYIRQLADGNIKINTQLVLCPGMNDGEQLKKSLSDLASLFPAVQMVAAVPVGITKYRDSLFPLSSYTRESARDVLDIIEAFADEFYEKHGVHFAWAADEFYLKAEKEIPCGDYYEDFAQLENGVGMWAMLRDDFNNSLPDVPAQISPRCVTVATGFAAFNLIEELSSSLSSKVSGLTVNVKAIKNDFFGHEITVSGLITGVDLISQLKNEKLGDELIIPSNMLRSDGDLFLDDVSLDELKNQLNIPVRVVYYNSAYELMNALLGTAAE